MGYHAEYLLEHAQLLVLGLLLNLYLSDALGSKVGFRNVFFVGGWLLGQLIWLLVQVNLHLRHVRKPLLLLLLLL